MDSSRTSIPTPPRRVDSERRDRLFPHTPDDNERREVSSDRQRALSARPGAKWPALPFDQRSAPDASSHARNIHLPPPTRPGALLFPADIERAERANINTSNGDEHSLAELDVAAQRTPPPSSPHHPRRPAEYDFDAMSDHPLDANLHAELEGKWILNLSMHFRDNSDREKFFITYAERPNVWRRVTVSCDYRDAPPDSLESDLRTLHYQRDKSARIYEALRDSLPDIQFYDSVTNLKLQTTAQRLHVHGSEDVNEIIRYPPLGAIEHLRCTGARLVPESAVCFASHLSGFVYKVSVHGRTCVKKEIPSPDTVDEFLYEVNALFALRAAPYIIDFVGIVVSDDAVTPDPFPQTPAISLSPSTSESSPPTPTVKGLLISFAPSGALVDLLITHTDNPSMPPISWPRRHKWAHQLLSGLHSIHSAGFVQGDLTLANVVIDARDAARIIDINRRGCPMGWEPPELEGLIRSGQRVGMYIGVKTDIWQLGMCLWALAMHNPEPEREEDELDFDDEDPAVAHVGHTYRNVVRACLAPDPAQRRGAAELLAMLDRDVGVAGWGSSATGAALFDTDANGGLHTQNGHAYSRAMDLELEMHGAFSPPLHQDSGFAEDTLLGMTTPGGGGQQHGYGSATSPGVLYEMPKELVGVGGAHAYAEVEKYSDELEI